MQTSNYKTAQNLITNERVLNGELSLGMPLCIHQKSAFFGNIVCDLDL